MRISCDSQSIAGAAQVAASAVASRTTKEVLSCLRLAAGDGGTLAVEGQDGEHGVRVEVAGVEVGQAGAVVCDASQMVRVLKDARGTVEVWADGETVRVNCDGAKFELPTRPVQEFPDIPAFDDGASHEVAAGILRTMIRRTAFAADKKDAGGRFALKGVLWEASDKAVRLVATDTKRLAVCEGPATVYGPTDGKTSHIVPPKAIALLERNLADDGELVRVCLRPNDALFRTERATVYTTLVQGRFPPWSDIVKKSRAAAAAHVELPVAEFLARVRQAAIVTDDESKRVDLTFSPGKVAMQARGAETGSSEVEMPLPGYDGPETTIAFDPSYVVEFLRALDGEPTVVLETGGPDKPAVFTCGQLIYLVMPLAG